MGCCGRNPCGSTGCADGDLQPASFEGTQHGLIPDQQCEAGAFYTCNGTNPPFWGCCASSPCSDGCPEGLLSAAFLTSNPATSEPFLRLNLTWTDEQTSGSADTSTNAGAIAGGVVGGVVALTILIIGLIWFHRRRKRAARREQQAQAGSQPRLSELPPQDRTDGSAMKYLPRKSTARSARSSITDDRCYRKLPEFAGDAFVAKLARPASVLTAASELLERGAASATYLTRTARQ